MVSGSRACLTFILSDHPHRPSRHFDGALARSLAAAKIIDLRTFADITAPEVFRWLSLSSIAVATRHIEFSMYRFGVGEDGLQPSPEVHRALTAPDGSKALVLRSKVDGSLTSMHEVWRLVPKDEMFKDLPPDTKKPITLNLTFPDPNDRYQIMTTDGLRDVADAEIAGNIWYELGRVPLTRYYEYLGEGGALVQTAEVELEREGTRIAFGLNATADRTRFSVTARRLDDSEHTAYFDVGVVLAVEDKDGDN